jgi:hypothetical protein
LPWSLDGVSHYFLLESLGKQVALLSQLLPLHIQAFKHFWNFLEVVFIAFKFSRGVYVHHCFLDFIAYVIKIIVVARPSAVAFQRPIHNFPKPTPVTRISSRHES